MLLDRVLEFRQAVRAAWHRPAYAALIVLILAVVVGAATAIFAVADSVLLQALPYPDADRLLTVWDRHDQRGVEQMNVSVPKVNDFVAHAESFEQLGIALGGVTLILSGDDEPQRLTATLASPELLQLTGVEPVVGRIFAADENRDAGAGRVAILSHDLWQGQFGGDARIVGQDITLGGNAYAVVGVMPADFVDFPFPAQQTDVWVPTVAAAEIYGVDVDTVRTARIFVGLARLRPGVTRQDALTELDGINANLAAAFPDSEGGWSSRLDTLRDTYLGALEPPVTGLAVGALLLFVIGCANVTSLLLVRASRRQRELVTRRALGASRRQLFRQVLTETMTLVVTGGVLGTLAAAWGVEALAGLVPVEWPRHIVLRADPLVYFVAFAMTIIAGFLAAGFSVLPAVRLRASAALASAARCVEPAGGALRRGLVVGEVAVAVTLLVGAGLLVQSFTRLRAADLGFAPDNLFALQLDTPADAFGADRLGVLATELEREIEGVPGVDDGYVWSPQVPGQSTWYTAVRPQDQPELRDDELPLVRFHYVGPGALEGIGLRFIAGRGIAAQDTLDGEGAVVLSESAARALWPGEDALGKTVRRWSRDRWLTVVGITEDAKLSGRRGPGTTDNLDVYFSFQQEPQPNLVVLASVAGDPATAIEEARGVVRDVLPSVPAFDVATMRERLAEQEAIPRFTAWLAGSFATTALFLAAIGLYGVLAYGVCLRSREIGLRLALGAQPDRIVRDVVGQGLRLAALGLAVGLAGAFVLTRWLDSLLFETSPVELSTFGATALVLLAVAAAASLVPARRAVRVAPDEALRGG